MLTTDKVYRLELCTEIHCEICGDIHRNYIEKCPICHEENTSTNAFFDLYDEQEFELKCLNCNSRFKLVSDSWYEDARVVLLAD